LNGVSRAIAFDCAPGSAEFVAAFLAPQKSAPWLCRNPFARSSDYIHYLENSEPRAAIIHSNALAEFLPASSVGPQMPIAIVGAEKINSNGVSFAKWSAWTAAASDNLLRQHFASRSGIHALHVRERRHAKAAVHLTQTW